MAETPDEQDKPVPNGVRRYPAQNGSAAQLANAQVLFNALKLIWVPLLGIISVFGTNMLMKGRDAQRLDAVEIAISDGKKEKEALSERLNQCVPRNDWNREIDRQLKQQERIEHNIDEIRRGR